jgi:hypothetical protein
MSLPRKVLAKYIKPGITSFRECGSRWGDTLARAMEEGAGDARGCEADSVLASLGFIHAKELCPSGYAVVHHLCSAAFLKSEATAKGKEILLFLDAHTETRSTVLEELDIVSRWDVKPYAILIDDIRCMKGWGIDPSKLAGILVDMGYKVSYEDGVEPNDIMVGTLA